MARLRHSCVVKRVSSSARGTGHSRMETTRTGASPGDTGLSAFLSGCACRVSSAGPGYRRTDLDWAHWTCSSLMRSIRCQAPTCVVWNLSSSVNVRSEEHTSELQSQFHLVCRLLLEKKKSK